MGDCHINFIADFSDDFGLELDLQGRTLLWAGAWTGGTSLLFAALGAKVTALEEVRKYAGTIHYFVEAFGPSRLWKVLMTR